MKIIARGKLKGSDIKSARTLKSRYDNDSIEVSTSNNLRFRIKVNDLVELLKSKDYFTRKPRVHFYAEPDYFPG